MVVVAGLCAYVGLGLGATGAAMVLDKNRQEKAIGAVLLVGAAALGRLTYSLV